MSQLDHPNIVKVVDFNQVGGLVYMEEKVGVGGMAEVYKATHVNLNKSWAIKILRTDTEDGFRAQERFLQEAQLMSQLDHPNIVKVVDFNQVGGLVYMVMELLIGNSLKSEIRLRNSNKNWFNYDDL